jgi:hypothetical protein
MSGQFVLWGRSAGKSLSREDLEKMLSVLIVRTECAPPDTIIISDQYSPEEKQKILIHAQELGMTINQPKKGGGR